MSKLISRSFAARAVGFFRFGTSLLAGSGAFLLAHGCVPTLKYEEARSAAEVEAEARRRSTADLDKARADVERLQAELRARDQKLDQTGTTLEQAKLEQDLAAKQRDENASLVDQLRGELARVGGDLQATASERARLEQELSAARSGSDPHAADRITLVRDLGIAVGAAKLERLVQIVPQGGDVVLRFPAEALFEPDTANFRQTLAPLFAVTTSRADVRERWSATLREVDPDPELVRDLGVSRRATLKKAIEARSLSAVLAFDAPEGPTPRQYEVVFSPKR